MSESVQGVGSHGRGEWGKIGWWRQGSGRLLAVGAMLIGLAGCDYWPPALQTQIEQLKADLQMITAERARLEQQVTTLGRAREELQSQVDQLSRSNRERATTIAELDQALKAARAPKAAAKPVAKSTAKTAVKSPVHSKRPVAKTTTKRTAGKSSTSKKKPETGTYYRTIR